ncbi:hypothetical protein [Nodularia sp. UHCC 0506]|uniref:hypothetical protein n=1 Tax=Nodularia sp. UHCC 0506 TaxID=3110243 RepID=UPI002B21E50B|nr:hypothetical protein [Nodularia sp. UHCC 0506]MEA5516143.1 hypothetical protein [Nodularia sp. UHCC 0506]
MDFSQFQSNQFWYQSDERQAQKLYVALCLYISAASDFAVGIDLKNNDKLNWSTTASYYSILHSARLIIFLAVGDYPQQNGHEDIRNLFRGQNRSGNTNLFSGNWLKKLARNAGFQSSPEDKFTLAQLCSYYKDCLQFPNSDRLFPTIGKILKDAKTLRNNSNYDALLMAHEWHHKQVEDDFIKLSNSMSDGAKLCLKISTQCFKSYISYASEIDLRREETKYLVKHYIAGRLYPSISQRIEDQSILNTVKECTRKLDDLQYDMENIKDSNNKLDEFEKSFLRDNFGEKQKLMHDFNRDVNNLKQDIKSVSNGSYI